MSIKYDEMQAETFYSLRTLETAEQVLVQYDCLVAKLSDSTSPNVYRNQLHAAITATTAPGSGPVGPVNVHQYADKIGRFV